MRWEDSIENSSVGKHHSHRYHQRHKVPSHEAKENQKRGQAVYKSACADMNRGSWAKQPHKYVGEEVAAKKDNVSNAVVEKEQGGPEEQQRKCVRKQVHDVAMDQRRYKNSY